MLGGLPTAWRPLQALQARTEAVSCYRRVDDASPLARRLDAIVRSAPSLQEPSYRPTPWARSAKANFALATARSRLGALRRQMEPPLRGRTPRTLQCADLDVVVEWSKDPVGYGLAADAPIVVFLHTITGSAAQTRWLMKYASLRGWRSCCFVRRGHGGPLHAPRFNLLGSVADVELQMAAVRRAYPDAAFVGMVGVSAGSAQLISYLGQAGSATPVGAACAICPAWDVPTAFAQLGSVEPFAERAMVKAIQNHFLRGRRNEAVLRDFDSGAYERCLAARSLPALIDAHAPFAMGDRAATASEYYAAHDPLSERRGVRVPTLVLNAEDDFVCPASLARPDLIMADVPGALLLVSQSGSHVAFNEGVLARGAFHLRISFDFLDAARDVAAAEGAAAAVVAEGEGEEEEEEDDDDDDDEQQQEGREAALTSPESLSAAVARAGNERSQQQQRTRA